MYRETDRHEGARHPGMQAQLRPRVKRGRMTSARRPLPPWASCVSAARTSRSETGTMAICDVTNLPLLTLDEEAAP
jgi:hypothetical protein